MGVQYLQKIQNRGFISFLRRILNTCFKQRRKCDIAVFARLSLACFVLNAVLPHATATSVVLPVPKQATARFLTNYVRLPANARGVLFKQELGNAIAAIQVNYRPYAILNQAPMPLSSRDFVAHAAGRRANLKVRKLQSLISFDRAIYVRDHDLYRCLVRGSFEATACGPTGKPPQTEAEIEALIKSGKVEDVSDLVHQMEGIFRIEPEFGFDEGVEYDFKDIRSKNVSFGFENSQIRVKIDPPLLTSISSQIALKIAAPQIKESVVLFPVFVEVGAYQDYKPLMSLDIETGEINEAGGKEYKPFRRVFDRVEVQCSNFREKPQGVVPMRVRTKFLEFSDDEELTPISEIQLESAGRSYCESTALPLNQHEEISAKWLSFENDYTLCGVKDKQGAWTNDEQFSGYSASRLGGERLDDKDLLLRLLDTPKVLGAQAYPPCFFRALSRLAGETNDPVLAERALTIFLSLFGSKVWDFEIDSQFRDLVSKLRQNIEAFTPQHAQEKRLNFDVFSNAARQLVRQINGENTYYVRAILLSMGKGNESAVPLLLAKEDIFLNRESRSLLFAVAGNDPRVIQQLLIESERYPTSNLSQILVSQIQNQTNLDVLAFVVRNSSRIDVCLAALKGLQTRSGAHLIFENELISYFKRRTTQATDAQLNGEAELNLMKMLISLEDRDTEIIKLLVSSQTMGLHGLSMMRKRARSAAPILVDRFKAIKSVDEFELLDSTMIAIRASSKLRKRAYSLAQHSQLPDVRAAARQRLQNL